MNNHRLPRIVGSGGAFRRVDRVLAVVVPTLAVAAIAVAVYLAAPVGAQNSAAGVCGRTGEVRDALVAASEPTACADVTGEHLRDVTALDLSGEEISSLSLGDFAGLEALRSLDLSDNDLTSLPAGVFDQLYSLRTLRLHDNDIATLPADVFDQLFVLETLTLHGNEVTALPEGMFDDLSPFGGVHLDQDVTGLDRLRAFVAQHSPTSVEDFIEALPDLHKERVVLVFESDGLGAEHISRSHPRVVSWGATGEFVFAWLTNPDAPDKFKQSVEFLIPGATSWTAGIIDFSGEEPEITRPTVCQSCHGAINKPLFPALFWDSTELYVEPPGKYSDPVAYRRYRDRLMEGHAASTNPRIEPLALDFPEHNDIHRQRLLAASEGAVAYEFPAEEVSRILALRHAEVLLGRLKARSDYTQFAEDALCATNPHQAMQEPFTEAFEHTLAMLADTGAILGSDYAVPSYSIPMYLFRTGRLQAALTFLVLHDLWETHAPVRDVYRATTNTDAIDIISDRVSLKGATAAQLLIHAPGQATAEDELVQLYRLNFGSGGRAQLAAVDSHSPTHLQQGTTVSDFEASQINNMAPRVCAALRGAKSPGNVRAAAAHDRVTVTWDAPPDTASVSGYRVMRSTDPDSEGTTLADTTSAVRRHVDTGVVADTTYYYTVETLRDPDRDYTSPPLEVLTPPDPNAPVIGSTMAFSVAEGATAVATLAATDADTAASALVWSIPPGAGGGADRGKFSLTAAGVLSLAAAKDFETPDDADKDGVYEVTVKVSDGTNSDTADVQVTLTNVNEAPDADAGANQSVEMGAAVTLAGLGTDPDAGDTLAYAWSQTSGTTVTLSGGATATATFTAPTGLTEGEVLVFTLTVTDAGGLTASDTVSVTVTDPLTASAEEVPEHHDGSRFSFELEFSENVPLSYLTVQNSLFEVTGGSVGRARRHAPPSNVRWVVYVDPASKGDVVLVVPAGRACGTTGAVCSDDDRMLSNRLEITVPGPAPVIHPAVEFSVAEGATAVATLTATDADTAASALVWSIPSGAGGGADRGEFSVTASGVLSFVAGNDFESPDDANGDGVYEVTVKVTDGDSSDTADVRVSLTNVNEAPAANAGEDQSVAMGAAVTLAGSGTDLDSGDTLSYAWSQTSGTTVTLSGGATATATFTAPTGLTDDDVLVFTLAVTDAGGLSAGDSVTVTVEGPPPAAPEIGSTSSFSVAEGATAVATLAATDADTAASALVWSIPSGAGGGADRGEFSVTASGVLSFVAGNDFESPDDANGDGVYEVTVKVTDGDSSDTADVRVSLTNVNEAPAANAGEDQSVAMGAAVTLAGSGTDLDSGDTLSYAWSQTSGTTVTLSGGATATATFTAPTGLTDDDVLVFTLAVTDAGGLSAGDSVTVTVEGPAPAHEWGERLADRDISLGDRSSPTGLWSNGTDVWVITDAATGDIGVYSLADGTEHASRGYRVASSGFVTALWSNGTTLWVAGFDGTVRAYRLTDGARQADRDLPTATLAAAGNTLPTGLWSDGTTMYVADYSARKVFAYDLATHARVTANELTLNEQPGVSYGPFGIWSNGTTMWVAEWAGRRVLAHDLATGQRQPTRDVSTAPSRTQYPNGIWSNGDITWILDDTAKAIYAYATEN